MLKPTSPRPSKNRRVISHPAPPSLAASGVSRVKTAVLNIPNPRAYFPPNFSESSPPGRWVIM